MECVLCVESCETDLYMALPTQTPAVEEHLESLRAALPPVFTDPATASTALAAHYALVDKALESVNSLKEGIDGEEWGWNDRVELDEDDEGEGDKGADEGQADGEGDVSMADGEAQKGRKGEAPGRKGWTAQETSTYLRTGKIPSL